MEEFDMAAAVSEIGSGMGFSVDDNKVIEGEATHVDDTDSSLGDTDAGIIDGNAATGDASAGTDDASKAAPTESGAAPASTSAPKTWRPEAAAEFSKLPAVVQQEILKREDDIFKGIEQYKESASFGSSVKNVLQPYSQLLQQYGMNPLAQVADMMDHHYVLTFGSQEQKAALIQRVFQQYQLDPSWLGVKTQQEDSPVWVDPQVEALQNQLKDLQSRLSQQENSQLEIRKKEITDHVQAFATDPKNVYFDELANDIAHLLRTGVEPTVEKAYEAAIWRNPAVRAKELARQQSERDEAERKAAAEKAEAARRASAANVRSSAHRGSATAPKGSIDDTLNETLAKIQART